MFRTAVEDKYAITDDFQLGQNSFQSQSNVKLAALPSGGFVAVWAGQDGFNNGGVRLQMYDGNGRPVGSESPVNLDASGGQGSPSVTALASGGFVVTWTTESPYPDVVDIHAQLFDGSGARVGAEFLVNSTTAGFQVGPEITGLAGGGFVISWEQQNDSGFDDIRAQVFNSAGAKVGGEFIVTDSRPGDKVAPTITALAGGGFVVGWFEWAAEVQDEWGNTSPGSRAQLFDAAGTKLGTAFSLNSFIVGYQQNPTVTALPNGGFVAAYADDGGSFSGQNTGHKGIWIQLFDANGSKVGAEIHASGLGPIGQDVPVIEVIPGTGFLVAWKDGNSTTENSAGHLRAQMFDLEGNKIGAEFSLNPGLGSAQSMPDLVYLSNGALVVGWADLPPPSYNDEGVRARMLFPIGHGTEGADNLTGGSNRDFFMGHGGADTIYGFAEDDGLSGGDGNDSLFGGDGNDNLDGGNGNDILDGGSGADTMAGGVGNDRYYVDDSGDRLIEAASDGDDIAFVLGTYTLAQGVSIETLYALNQDSTDPLTLTGNEYGQSLYGNLGDNYLNGGQGNDYLVGLDGNDNLLGGTGADNMAGGTGNDVYYADDAGDRIFENAGEGNDLVVVTASWTLNVGAEVETMSADPNAGNINLTGNELGQSIYGNAGNNILIGMGGSDYMVGGGGNDRYYVDVSDFIGESIGGGDDTIVVATSYTLREGNEIETLVAWNQDSTDPVDLTGNEFGQTLYGSQGVNSLNGGGGNDYLVGLGGNDFLLGGEGDDNLNGGGGNDIYYVDGGDHIIEATGEGEDIAVALVSFVLNAGASVETLGAAEGTAAIDLPGNELGQSLYGNAGANVLNGAGGNDYLTGGSGSDSFDFTTALGAGNVDGIADFSVADDTIRLDDAVFTGLATGALSANAFVVGSGAQDADDRIVYNSATGALYFDADGNGAGAAVQFATLQAGLSLTAADFVVI